jgi:hypothetical protein
MHSQARHYSSRFGAHESQSLWRSSLTPRTLLQTKRPPPEKSSLHPTRRCQRRSTRLVPLLLFSRVARLRLRSCVLSALRAGRDGNTPTARRVRCERARPARLSATRPARAAAPCKLPALAPSSCSTRAAPPCLLRGARSFRRALAPPGSAGSGRLQGCRSRSARGRPQEQDGHRQHPSAHGCAALPKRRQQPARGAARLLGRLLRWGELMRWKGYGR